jgi:hypothetical protein
MKCESGLREGMMRKGSLIALAVAGVLLSGCPKHNRSATSPAPAAPEAQKTGEEAKSDSAFNKYYTGSNDSAKVLGKPTATFSMRKQEAAPVKKPAMQATEPAPAAAAAPKIKAVSPATVVAPQASAQEAPASLSSASGRFTVQVASTPSNGEAEHIAAEFRGKGYEASIIEVQNPRSDLAGTYYRVRVGSFAGEAEAKSFGESVARPAHLDYWVVRKPSGTPGSSFNTPEPVLPVPAVSAPRHRRLKMAASSGTQGTETAPASSAYSRPYAVEPAPGAQMSTAPSAMNISPDTGLQRTFRSSSRSADSGVKSSPSAPASAGYPTFNQLMKAIDDDQRKSASARNAGTGHDTLSGK